LFHIAHLTSVHSRIDTRIFLKMCTSLARKGYVSHLVVADGEGEAFENGVYIHDVGMRTGGRITRMTKTVNKVFEKAVTLDVDLYHLHDPELIPIGLKLKKLGKKVVFDAHEDLPKQLRSKPYLNKISQIVLSKIMGWYESYACSKYDAIICATPIITDKFLFINDNSVNINNYPILGELSTAAKWEDKFDEVCYLGGIARIRGIEEVIKSLSFLEGIRLNLAGKFSEAYVEKSVKNSPEWKKVNELGFLSRKKVSEVLARSKVGLVTFHNVPNHIDAQPNKMFEYMSAGIPIVTSNFPMWKEIVVNNKCGVCVDPKNPQQIADAINFLITNPIEASEMANNGYEAVQKKYNWGVEEKKLFNLYEGLLF
jgi:glycosyltransferase involved in cell wall biosynthesis